MISALYGYTQKELDTGGNGRFPSKPSRHMELEAVECLLRKGEYHGRIETIMNMHLSQFDKIAYKCLRFVFNEVLLPSILIYPIFNAVFKGNVKMRVFSISSSSDDHILSINGRTFCLVGNDRQFGNQFLSERKVLVEKIRFPSFTKKLDELAKERRCRLT